MYAFSSYDLTITLAHLHDNYLLELSFDGFDIIGQPLID